MWKNKHLGQLRLTDWITFRGDLYKWARGAKYPLFLRDKRTINIRFHFGIHVISICTVMILSQWPWEKHTVWYETSLWVRCNQISQRHVLPASVTFPLYCTSGVAYRLRHTMNVNEVDEVDDFLYRHFPPTCLWRINYKLTDQNTLSNQSTNYTKVPMTGL